MISIRKIRISNFKSIQAMELIVDKQKTVFVGQNNAGKSNINKAIDCAFNLRYSPSEYDIHNQIKSGQHCYIDVMLTSNTDDKCFEEAWLIIFGENVVKNELGQDSFTIRTVISQNDDSKRFEIERFPILDWNSTEFVQTKTLMPKEIRKCINTFYINADRDIVDELRIRNSNFSNLMKNANFEINENDSTSIEQALEIGMATLI